MKKLIFLLCLFTFFSCSKNDSSAGVPSSTRVKNPLESDNSGTYQAILAPLNKTVSGHLNGSLTLVREKDDLIADVRVSSGPPGVIMNQNIHIGNRCPDERDDLNTDGYIDGQEAAVVYKEIILPLDDELNSQWMGLGIFPTSDEFGNYFWGRRASYEKFLADLREEDINPTDDFKKLGKNKSLSFKEKVIVIRGIPDSVILPETVSGRGRLSANAALPVACGVLRVLSTVPGVIDTDETDMPVPGDGETVGGGGGVDDGATFSHSNGGGNYGDDDDPTNRTTNTTEYCHGGTNGG